MILIGFALCPLGAAAQTNVTTSGGTANTVPAFTGSSAIGNSPIATSSGNVGIGTTSPSYTLEVNGDSSFDSGVHIGSFGTGTSPVFLYPNLVSAQFNGTESGTFVVHTDITRTSDEMFKIRVVGYGYGNGFNIDFTVVGYAYAGQNGNVDNNPGAIIAYSINDTGNDGLPKYVGVDANGYVAVGVGTYTGSYYYYRFSADYWTTRQNINATSGWSINQSTVSGLGWLDFHQLTPDVTQLLSGNVGIGTTSPGQKLEVNGNIKLTAGSGGSITFQDGTTQSTAYTGSCGGDFAESIDVTGDRTAYGPGDVLVLDPENPGMFLKSTEAYSTSVSGIYSTKPGMVGRRQLAPKSDAEVPMAMVGVVPTKVSNENGPIKVGDLLVSSSATGYAMKGTDRSRMLGAVIGKAMGTLDSDKGVIEVLVTLQ
jgi:hypothetical protein